MPDIIHGVIVCYKQLLLQNELKLARHELSNFECFNRWHHRSVHVSSL